MAKQTKHAKIEKATLAIKEQLGEVGKRLDKSDSLFGITLLTQAGYISASRAIMWTSHFRQARNLNNPQKPKNCTGYENVVGKFSSNIKKAKRELEVIDIIPRFKGMDDKKLYMMIVYDRKKDRYDIIEKKNICDLTEFYSFKYNTDGMDKFGIGDSIPKDTTLYASTSYDKNDNYMFGTHVPTLYAIENYVIEDAIILSDEYVDAFSSTDSWSFTVSMNDNDILANLYGDSENYKCFPDIGEKVSKKVVACVKRINKNQLLYDFKKQNLEKINFVADTPFYASGEIEDIFIYSNKTLNELPDNRFYNQIREYIAMQDEYYTHLYHACLDIIESGSKYTDDVNYYFKRAKEYLSKDTKWVSDSGAIFNNIIIEFTVSNLSTIKVGHKLTGRCGNKGVVSKIVPASEMPVTEDGQRVGIIVSALGVINRMNSFQLFELERNFIGYKVGQKLKTLSSLKEKEDIVFPILELLNDFQDVTDNIKKLYYALPDIGKEEFFDSISENGLYYKVSVLFEPEPVFYRLMKVYDMFEWLTPTDLFIRKFGRDIKIMRKAVVADLYYIKLRQSSKKGFSARSTGPISKIGLPEKSNRAKTHQDINSRTPIRSGNMETINMLVGVAPETIAQLHKYYRTSIAGRRELGRRLMSSTEELETIETENEVVNTTAEILNAYLKVMGIRINFSDDNKDKDYVIYEDDDVFEWEHDNGSFIGTRTEYKDYIDRCRALDNIIDGPVRVLSEDEYNDLLEKEIESMRHEREGTRINIDI